MGAFGLYTHIRNNNIKSVLLLCTFPFLLLMFVFGIVLFFAAQGASGGFWGAINAAVRITKSAFPWCVGAALVWFVIAYFWHEKLIDSATGAVPVDRASYPRLYNLLENLSITAGMPMPSLKIIETPALNAFASGISPNKASIAVTRGLIDTLSERQMQAVLAHELTHVKNRDVRLMVVTTIFAGIITFLIDSLFRSTPSPRAGDPNRSGTRIINIPSSSNSRSKDSGSGAAAIVAVALIAAAYVLALIFKSMISQTREYVADAGAIELTKDPDAMILALKKIAVNSHVDGIPNSLQAMFIDDPEEEGGAWFDTHPSMEMRIRRLVDFAGGREPADSSSLPIGMLDRPPVAAPAAQPERSAPPSFIPAGAAILGAGSPFLTGAMLTGGAAMPLQGALLTEQTKQLAAAAPGASPADLPAMETLAARGDRVAAMQVALIRRDGGPEVRDPAKALRWFTQAAALGDVDALFALGEAYRDGIGIARKPQSAARFFRSAVNYGHRPAMLALSAMHDAGDGVAKDPVEAYALAAAALGAATPGGPPRAAEADQLLARLHASLPDRQRPLAEERARTYAAVLRNH